MKSIRILLKYIIPYKWQAAQNIIYNLLSAVFALFTYTLAAPFLRVLFNNVEAYPEPGKMEYTTKWISDFLNYNFSLFVAEYGQARTLFIVSMIVIVASLFKNGFIFLANNSMAYLRAGTVRDMRRSMYAKVLRLPLSFFSDSRKGDIMTRVSNDVQEVEASVMASLTMLFRDPITILIFLGYLFSSSLQLTLFALILLPVSGILIGKVGKTLKSASRIGQQNLGKLLSVVEETLSGLRIIKGFNAEEQMTGQFSQSNEKFTKIFRRVTRKRYLASPLSEFLSTIVVMLLMYYGGILAIRGTGTMTPDKLIAYLIVFSQLIPPVKNLTTSYFNILKGMASMERIEDILDADEKIHEKEDAVDKVEFGHSIEFRNVWFSYGTEPVLRDINLKINKGETIALVGKSGGGKSTMVDLIPRFMDVDKGSILVDGIDIRDIKVKSLRSMMGIVSQNPILFNDSFTGNIAFGRNGAVGSDVESAARIANAHEFIVETEEGYDTGVGESGSKLSGGQRQRISIARAVLANPPILILDEATSALDTESERLVQDAIVNLMKNRTSIVIAHRLSTIQHADKIVVIDDGRIVEEGTHNELLKKKGHYYKLHKYQALD